MIVEALINLITAVIKLIVIPFNILPDVPEGLETSINYYIDLIFNNLDFLSFFVHISTLKTIATMTIVIYTIEKSYSLLMWIIHKLPLSID